MEALKGKLNVGIEKIYPELEDLSITPSKEEQIFNSNKYGYDTVTVNPIECEEIVIKPNKEQQVKEGMYDKIIVNGDENLISENIKSGVEIFGVEGTAEVKGEENAIIDTKTKLIINDNNFGNFDSLIKKIPLIKIPDDARYFFYNFKSLQEIPEIDTSKVTNMNSIFYDCKSLTAIPKIDTSNVTNMLNMFCGCSSLISVPEIDMSKALDTGGMFTNCSNLISVPKLDTSKSTNVVYMFANCKKIVSVPPLDLSRAINIYGLFQNCSSLTTIPSIKNIISATNMTYFFQGCSSLITIPEIDTFKISSMNYMFQDCSSLTTLPLLNMEKITSINSAFSKTYNLENVLGFYALGKAYTSKTKNYSNYQLNLSDSTKLTHDSLMNIINNLYDLNLTYKVSSGGTLASQSLKIGSENIAKLTEEEIAIATAKGWNVS